MAHHPFDDPKADELPEKSMNIAVIIPSALRTRPGTDELWLARALRSVQAQTLQPKEIIVGVDPNVPVSLEPLIPTLKGGPVRLVAGHIKGHQAACNAAAEQATAPLLAFLEDDDEWTPDHLERMVKAMNDFDSRFVTASQLEVMPDGSPIREFHFATMSSWVISRLSWMALGGVDIRFQIHHDNEFLDKVACATNKYNRVHLVQEGANLSHQWLKNISENAQVVARLPALTVRRTVHPESVLADCYQKSERLARSQKEYAALEVLYGTMGW